MIMLNLLFHEALSNTHGMNKHNSANLLAMKQNNPQQIHNTKFNDELLRNLLKYRKWNTEKATIILSIYILPLASCVPENFRIMVRRIPVFESKRYYGIRTRSVHNSGTEFTRTKTWSCNLNVLNKFYLAWIRHDLPCLCLDGCPSTV